MDGSFTTYSGAESNRIIRLDSEGTPDSDFAVGSGFDGVVYDIRLVPGDSGDIYVCGGFNGYNGSASNRIIRLHSDGSVDDSLAVGDGFDGSAYRTIAAPDDSGDIYALGRFASYNGTVSRNLVRLHSNGSVNDEFDVGAGFGPRGPPVSC